ncbi:TetR/AcrR family transcriptional regulator [Zhihengliuella halotolerans]|uniref:TetR/AcrR family transcriptional regulator n=1 Tax=Zhihengliuella halotolerans TaxID=370736 RepID=UPI000C80D4E3|nr:TetR/AcrR family transcriptional regulator [Zhihengliuella halotolerans]
MAQRRGEYKKTAARREQILDAALDVFSRTGYTASSVNEIARSVGMTQTGVLHHFPGGKIALFRAVMERRDAIALEILGDRAGVDFLAGLVEISRRQTGQRGVVQLYRILSAESTDPEHPAHSYFKQRLAMIAGALERVFRELEGEGRLRAGVDPRRAALDGLALTEGLELMWLNGFEVDMAADIRRYFNAQLTEDFLKTP